MDLNGTIRNSILMRQKNLSQKINPQFLLVKGWNKGYVPPINKAYEEDESMTEDEKEDEELKTGFGMVLARGLINQGMSHVGVRKELLKSFSVELADKILIKSDQKQKEIESKY